MRPKEKAEDLISKMYSYVPVENGKTCLIRAKFLAIACVNEIIEALKITTGHCDLRKLDQQEVQSDFNYWRQVKEELEVFK